MKKIDSSLFDGRVSPEPLEPCPKCSSHLVVKHSKNGAFFGCSNYPKCDYLKPLTESSVEVLKNIDHALCKKCGSGLQIKKGRFGLFIGCSNYPSCDFVASFSQASEKEDEPISIDCPHCGHGKLTEKTNRYGKRFFSCSHYPACRYVVNFPPINSACPQCGWSILVKKGGVLMCPQKSCGYKINE